ncbi:unnamed protein product [marine sediment metagenome]|uniref:Uncharacterized protein n=1 Tax=marine sediment metagenome TaxID=412755 RepID=X1RZR4_9ZZZZ
MANKNIVSNEYRQNNYKKFRCPEDYKKCQYYNPKQPKESRCILDSSIGCCVKEYFDYHDKLEVITENGDIE